MKMNELPRQRCRTSALLQQLMILTMEECGELTQACSKIMRHGFGKKQRKNFIEEIGDVQCMIELLQEYDYILYTEIEERIKVKRAKLSEWSDLVENPER